MHEEERVGSAVQPFRQAVARYSALEVRIERLLTNNGAPIAPRCFPRHAKHWDHAHLHFTVSPSGNAPLPIRFVLQHNQTLHRLAQAL